MEDAITQLIALYQELYGSKITIANLDQLATDLSQIAGRSRPWTGKFLHSLIKGYSGFTISKKFIEALNVMSGRLNDFTDIQAQTKQTTVLTLNDLPAGTIILGQAQRCATPGCQVSFVPTHPCQKYHNKACAKINRRRKRHTHLK